MSNTGRFALTKGRKILLWMGVVLCAWLFLPLDSVIEAFLMFCFGGNVPGTHIVLAPTTVMIIVGATLVGGCLFFIIRGLTKALRDPGHHLGHTELDPHRMTGRAPVDPVVAMQPVIVTTDTAISSATTAQMVQASEYAIPQFVVQALIANLPEAPEVPSQQRLRAFKTTGGAWLQRTLQKSKIALIHFGRIVRICAIIVYILIRRAAFATGSWITKQSVVFWRWSAPYLWQFDAWLGRIYLMLRKKTLKTWREVRRAIEKR